MKILTALKHLFIPHEHNDYKPHFFREVSVAIILAVSIFLLGVSAGSSFFLRSTVLGANVTASVLIDLTNESRLAYNQTPLVRSSLLDRAAEMKAENMIEEGYFAHNSPKGITPWYWFQQVGYAFLYAGENLAINFTDAAAVRDAWLASPKHRENLLDIRFKEIGMATLDGTYKNDPTIYVVQLFGTPAVVHAATTTEERAVEEEKIEQVPLATTAGSPEIKGEQVAEQAPADPYKPILVTPELAVVQNTQAVEKSSYITPDEVEQYSAWYERLLFGGSYYVQLFYKGLLVLVIAALLVMVAIEIRRQHWRHIAYGLALALILSLCIIINQAFF